jgi:hypothetical protein
MKDVAIVLLLNLCSVISFSACSLIGYGIGSYVDSRAAKIAGIDSITIEELNIGQDIRIELRDTRIIDGTYIDIREYGSGGRLYLEMSVKGERILYHMDSIDQIHALTMDKNKIGRIAGFLVGFGLDVYVIRYIIHNADWGIAVGGI